MKATAEKQLLVFIVTNSRNFEYRYERYVDKPFSRMDIMLAEDSVCKSYFKMFGEYPKSIKRWA